MSLLSRLMARFRDTHAEPLPAPDEKLAFGALLVRVAMSDNEYALAEISLIDRILAQHFKLNPIEAAKMRATCEKLQRAAPRSGEFAELIRKELSHDERLEALADLWRVVIADGHEEAVEAEIVEAVRGALGLSAADSAEARQMAGLGQP
jgi:uncharacterized tellurite resistance protein B-like protein